MTRVGSLSLQARNAAPGLRGVSTLGELRQIFVESNNGPGPEKVRPGLVVNRLNPSLGVCDVAPIREGIQILFERLNRSKICRI